MESPVTPVLFHRPADSFLLAKGFTARSLVSVSKVVVCEVQ